MTKLIPVITEKSTKMASEGKYTFRVSKIINKYQIKKLVEDTFNVHVTDVHTINEKAEVKRNLRGRKKIIMPTKKAIVCLREKEKINLFEESKK